MSEIVEGIFLTFFSVIDFFIDDDSFSSSSAIIFIKKNMKFIKLISNLVFVGWFCYKKFGLNLEFSKDRLEVKIGQYTLKSIIILIAIISLSNKEKFTVDYDKKKKIKRNI